MDLYKCIIAITEREDMFTFGLLAEVGVLKGIRSESYLVR